MRAATDRVAESVVALPHPSLRSSITRYIGYRYQGFPAGVHVGLPSRSLTFIVSFGAPVRVGLDADPVAPVRPFDALVGGLHAIPAFIHHDGDQHGVQVEMTPFGARRLLGLPAAELTGHVVHVREVLGGTTVELVERLRSHTRWPDRFAVLDDVLGRVPAAGAPPAPVAAAWQRLVDTAGAIGVSQLADDLGWSRRHLGERFRREFGLPPKTMARVLRFERARALLVRSDRPTIGRVAAACGYADQAHLAREWRVFAGRSPSAWIDTEVLPFVQDDGDAAVTH